MSRFLVLGAACAAAMGVLAVSNPSGAVPPESPRAGLDTWVSVSAANSDNLYGEATHTCGVQQDGSLWCWGVNSSGELGLGDTDLRYQPNRVGVGTNWLSVSAGETATCGIRAPGTLWCWGARFGTDVPLRVGSGSDWRSISLGGYNYPGTGDATFRCGIRGSSSLWCWGENSSGQLGLGDQTDRTQPTRVGGGWSGVVTGVAHTCAIRTSGTLWCWGSNANGQLGLGDGESRYVPTQVDAGSLWDDVSAGTYHSCGVQRDGGLWCWGWGGYGQLGDGHKDVHYSPVPVGTSHDWSDVETGSGHSCATRDDASLWCWGNNDEGQLGIGGTPLTKLRPAKVGSDAWATPTTGNKDTCAIQPDHTLWCWGMPDNGQLGVGNRTVHTEVPVQVGLPNDPGLVPIALTSVDELPDGQVWAVGKRGDVATRPFAERWDGTSWRRPPVAPVGDSSWFNDVAAVSSDDVWAVGSYRDGTQRMLIEHWDGTSWSKDPVPERSAVLTSVSALASDDIWAVGYTSVNLWYAEAVAYHYDGTRWSEVDTAPMNPWSNQSFLNVEMLSPTDVWAVGWGRKDDEAGALPFAEHWDGQQWTTKAMTPPASYDDHYLRGMAVVNPHRIWALGDWTQNDGADEQTLGRLWDGKRWVERQLPDPGRPPGTYLRGAVAAASRDVWGVGQTYDGQRYVPYTIHFDGAAWTQITPPSPKGGDTLLSAVTAQAADDVWTVGSTIRAGVSAPLVEHWDGSAWSIVQERTR